MLLPQNHLKSLRMFIIGLCLIAIAEAIIKIMFLLNSITENITASFWMISDVFGCGVSRIRIPGYILTKMSNTKPVKQLRH